MEVENIVKKILYEYSFGRFRRKILILKSNGIDSLKNFTPEKDKWVNTDLQIENISKLHLINDHFDFIIAVDIDKDCDIVQVVKYITKCKEMLVVNGKLIWRVKKGKWIDYIKGNCWRRNKLIRESLYEDGLSKMKTFKTEESYIYLYGKI